MRIKRISKNLDTIKNKFNRSKIVKNGKKLMIWPKIGLVLNKRFLLIYRIRDTRGKNGRLLSDIRNQYWQKHKKYE